MNREKKTRAVLAELGIKPESAAVSLKAAKEALLRVMPDSRSKAITGADLFRAAIVPSLTTGNKALRELVSEGKIQRIGKPRAGFSCRYFAAEEPTQAECAPAPNQQRRKPKLSRTKQNSALLKMMRGEETKHAREVADATRPKGYPKHY